MNLQKSHYQYFPVDIPLPEHDTGLVTTLHPLNWMDPLYDGSLPDIANVYCSSKPSQNFCRVEKNTDIGLEVLASHRLLSLWTSSHHPSPELCKGDVQGQGSALLGSH